MQKKVILSERKSDWTISFGRQPRHQAAELVEMTMPRGLRLVNNFLRLFGWHIDRRAVHTHTPVVSEQERQLRNFLGDSEINKLYSGLTDENKFEIYQQILQVMQNRPASADVQNGLHIGPDDVVYFGDTAYTREELLAENRFIGRFYSGPASIYLDNERFFELRNLSLNDGIKARLFKNGLYLFQFFQHHGQIKMTANEIVWNSNENRYEIPSTTEGHFRLIPPNQ